MIFVVYLDHLFYLMFLSGRIFILFQISFWESSEIDETSGEKNGAPRSSYHASIINTYARLVSVH